jgi:dTDP-4-amino-4,6-dideoxygalactose transaminase
MIVSGIGAGDEVICPSLSFIASANAITYTGAKPVFADISRDSLNLDVEKVKEKITPKTKAVLLVHQIGFPADIDNISHLCKEYNLILIEDAACALGSEYKDKKIGSHSDIVCFSFHPRKIITTGEGGMITTRSAEIYEKLRVLRNQGISIISKDSTTSSGEKSYEFPVIGYNYRLTDIQAAMGIKQMEKIDFIVNSRRSAAEKYNRAFNKLTNVTIFRELEGSKTNYQSYCIYLKDTCKVSRDELIKKLEEKEIYARKGIPAIHLETAYRNKYESGNLSITEDVSLRSVLLPIYAPMTDNDVQFVIDNVLRILSVTTQQKKK